MSEFDLENVIESMGMDNTATGNAGSRLNSANEMNEHDTRVTIENPDVKKTTPINLFEHMDDDTTPVGHPGQNWGRSANTVRSEAVPLPQGEPAGPDARPNGKRRVAVGYHHRQL
jgi:hypothetical protein